MHAAAASGDVETVATAPDTAPAYMAQAALGFTEQLERVFEVGLLLLLGGMLAADTVALDAWWFVALLFLVVRPLAVAIGAPMRGAPPIQRRLTMWFGIRGIGSLYYLFYALAHGVEGPVAERLVAIVFTVVAASAVVHGVSVTPLMTRYERKVGTASDAGPGGGEPEAAPAR